MHIFSERLIGLRKSKSITQKQLAQLVCISERNYQRLEANNSPKLENLIKLADYFDVSIDYLVGRTDNPEINR